MARVGLEQLDSALRELFDLLHDRGGPVESLQRLEKRVLDIDDPFVHATIHLVMLSLDSVWHVRDTRLLDVVETDRQAQDARLARHVFGPNDFSAQPPLADAWPTRL